MAKKLSSVLGIDIGSHSIKVCEVKLSGNQPTVSAVGVAPTPEGAVDYSGVYNADAVGATLKKLIADSGAASPNTVVSIAGQHSVLVRVLEVPKMDEEKELKSHMEWEISKNIPFAESSIQSDYKAIPNTDPNSVNMDVVMAMAPQSAIDTIIECVKKSGKKPYAIDVEPLAIGRLIQARPELKGIGGICVVNIGHSTTSVNIYQDGNLVLPRPVPGGGEQVTRAIADALQVGVDEAEGYKHERFVIPADAQANSGFVDPFAVGGMTGTFDAGFAPGAYDVQTPTSYDSPSNQTMGMDAMNPDQDLAIDPVTGLPIEAAPQYSSDPFSAGEPAPAFDPFAAPAPDHSADPFSAPQGSLVPSEADPTFASVSPILEDLVAELQRSIDYHLSRGGVMAKVVLCGGGSKLNGLSGYLQRSLNLNVEVFDPLEGFNLAPKKVGIDYINEYRQQVAVAVGNGLHIAY